MPESSHCIDTHAGSNGFSRPSGGMTKQRLPSPKSFCHTHTTPVVPWCQLTLSSPSCTSRPVLCASSPRGMPSCPSTSATPPSTTTPRAVVLCGRSHRSSKGGLPGPDVSDSGADEEEARHRWRKEKRFSERHKRIERKSIQHHHVLGVFFSSAHRPYHGFEASTCEAVSSRFRATGAVCFSSPVCIPGPSAPGIQSSTI